MPDERNDRDDDRPRPRRRRRDDDEYDDDDFDDDRPRRRDDDFEPAGLIVPLGVSPLSIASCYLGIIGLCLTPLAPFALICGILALRKRKKNSDSYAGVTSDVRAWIGVACGALGTLMLLATVVLVILFQTGTIK